MQQGWQIAIKITPKLDSLSLDSSKEVRKMRIKEEK